MKESFSFVEISHPIKEGMKTYPGLPIPEVSIVIDYESSREIYHHQSEFKIACLHVCGNTGTYVDSPAHRYQNGMDLSELPLSSLAHLPVKVIDATDYPQRGIGPDIFQHLDLQGKAVLIRTDWSKHWGTEHYFEPHPYLTAEACDYLLKADVKFVGIDSLNIDDTNDMARPAHTKLLGAGIPVCEHLTNLVAIPHTETRLHAVPIAWVGGATFPVRAYVMDFEK
jgi:arylformamidase